MGSFCVLRICLLGAGIGLVAGLSGQELSLADDVGELQNCAADTKHNFTIMWSPKTIQMGQNVSIAISLKPAVSLTNGTVSIKASLAHFPIPKVIHQSFTCGSIHEKLPSVPCPLERGVPIYYDKVVQVPKKLVPFHATYKVQVTVHNSQDELLLCAEGELHIN